jgi:hypothetical protein
MGGGMRRMGSLRGLGGSSAAPAPSIASIMGAAFVEEFDGADATDADWPGKTGAFTLSVLSGTPVPDADRFGAQDRARIQLTADYYVSAAAGLGDLPAGATAQPFALVVIWQSDTTSVSRALCGWGSTAGGTGGAYADIWARAAGYSFRWHNDANGNVDIEPITGVTADTRERALIISYAGAAGALRIDEWTEDGWTTAITSTPTNSGAFTTIDRFIIGGRLAGSGTPSVPINPVNGALFAVGNAALTDAQFTALRTYISDRYNDLTTHILTDRTQIINSATATFPGTDGNNIMFGSIVRAASWHVTPLGTYYCLFGDHDGAYIRVAYANDVEGPWTVVEAGTDITLTALNTAGSYTGGTHVSSPHVIVDEANERYLCYVHGDSTGLGHESVLAESVDLVTWTFVNAAARLSNGTGMIYIRPFTYDGAWYAVSDTLNLFTSADGLSSWTRQSTATVFRGGNGDNGRHAGPAERAAMARAVVGDGPDVLHLTPDARKDPPS